MSWMRVQWVVLWVVRCVVTRGSDVKKSLLTWLERGVGVTGVGRGVRLGCLGTS
jgi:hypothetical protein